MTNKNAAPERITPDAKINLLKYEYDFARHGGNEQQQNVIDAEIRGLKFAVDYFSSTMLPTSTESDKEVARDFLERNGGYDRESEVLALANLLAAHRQPSAQPVPHVEVSKTAEELEDIESLRETAARMAARITFLEEGYEAHAIRAGELVRDVAAQACGNAVVFAERIHALDIATILKGDK